MQPVAWVVLSLAVLFVAAPPVLIVSLLKERRRNFASEARAASLGDEVEICRKRFSEIFNLDSEISRLKAEIDLLEQERSSLFAKNKADKDEQERLVADIRSQYNERKSVYDRLIGEIAIFDERLAFAEMGVYEPHFDFGDSENYKLETEKVRNIQKRMISDKAAVLCTEQWTLNGDAKKGQMMTDRNIRLTVRAFNNECEASISNTRWNDVNAMEKRISRAKDQIDKLKASNQISQPTFLLKNSRTTSHA